MKRIRNYGCHLENLNKGEGLEKDSSRHYCRRCNKRLHNQALIKELVQYAKESKEMKNMKKDGNKSTNNNINLIKVKYLQF